MADQLQFTEEQIKEVLQRSYAMILQDCDGAISHDNVGFRANDSKFARRITSIPTDQWSQYLTWDAYITLNTYKKQLLDRHGIDYDLIPQPQKPDAENKNIRDLGRYEAYLSARKSVLSQRVGQSNTDNGQPSAKAQADYDAERDTFRVYFLDLKDAQFRNDFKNKVRGARYEAANKFWIVPKFFYHDLEAFANANKMTPDGSTGMVLTDEAKQAIEDFKGTVYNVQPIDIDTVGFYLGGYYHEPLVQALRNLPGHKFVRGANQHNRAKPVVQAVEIAKRFNLTVHPSTFDLIEWHQSDRMARRFAKQKEDADREIALADHLRPFQRVGAEEAIKRKHILLGDDRGVGKAVDLDTDVLTPSGWSKIRDLREGDYVVGSDGLPTKITGVFPQGERNTYRVKFNDGSSVYCDSQHLWTVQTQNWIKRGTGYKTKTLAELINSGIQYSNGELKYRIPIVEPVVFEGQPYCEFDPYAMGVLLGDGGFTRHDRFTISLTNSNSAIVEDVRKAVESVGDRFVTRGNQINEFDIRGGNLLSIFEEYDLLGKYSYEKRIPAPYLWASDPQDRLEVLRGLLDTDSETSGASIGFCSTSKGLVEDVVFLVNSLGGTTGTIRNRVTNYTYNGEEKQGRESYRVSIRLPQDVQPTRHKNVPLRKQYVPARYIASVEYIGKRPLQCIKIDNTDGLFVVNDFIITHNTRTAISAIETWRRYPAVVVCPPSATGNWVREIQALLPDDEIYVCSGRSGKLVVSDWIIVPYSVAPNWLPELYPAQALVCDESHYLKNSDANRTQAVREYRKRMHENSLIMLLSGTFLKSRPNELIEQFKILHPNYMREEFGGQENFFFRFCGGNDPNIKSENELELHQRLSETVLLRRTKEDVLPELPPKELRHLTFTLDSNKLKEYHRVERDFINWVTENYGREAADRASRAEAITRLNALRQLAGQAKIEEVVEWVEDFINGSDRDPSLIIFAHHKSVQDALTNTLRDRGHDVSVIVGGQKIDNLEREKEKFQNGETKIIVCSMEAGKESHTLTAANDVIFVEQPWTPSDLNQALDRAHRIGQVNAVTGYNFMAEDTIDIHMHNVITEKAQIVNAIQDGIPMDMEDHFSEFDIADEVIDRIVAR